MLWYLRKVLRAPLITVLILILSMACTASDPAPVIIESESDDGPGDLADAEIASGDTADIEIEGDGQASTPSNEEEFRKPSTSEISTINPTDMWTPENQAGVIASRSRIRSRVGVRPHMPCLGDAITCFLYEGEYLVFDASTTMTGKPFLPNNFLAVILHEGRPLPFRQVLVDERFVPMEEIESWSESDFSRVQSTFRENDVPINYTLVVPPWAFPEPGVYNLQILTLPDWQSNPDRRFLTTATSGYESRTGYIEDRSIKVHYAGNEFQRSSRTFRNRRKESSHWNSTLPGPATAVVNFQFLTPPREICDWHKYEEDPFSPPCMTEVHDIPADTITLKMYTVAGSAFDLLGRDTRGTNLYYVMRDDEVIDAFLFHPEVDSDITSLMHEETIGVKLPIEVELTDKKAVYQVVAVPEPFEPLESNFDRNTRRGNLPNYSNALLLRRAPERSPGPQNDSDLDY